MIVNLGPCSCCGGSGSGGSVGSGVSTCCCPDPVPQNLCGDIGVRSNPTLYASGLPSNWQMGVGWPLVFQSCHPWPGFGAAPPSCCNGNGPFSQAPILVAVELVCCNDGDGPVPENGVCGWGLDGSIASIDGDCVNRGHGLSYLCHYFSNNYVISKSCSPFKVVIDSGWSVWIINNGKVTWENVIFTFRQC